MYFSDYFDVKKSDLDAYGALNISLLNDLPLFIDPFLLFNSEKIEYKSLHDEIIHYLKFLKGVSTTHLPKGIIQNLYTFHEVRQTWLGFSKTGNKGQGLGIKFAKSLNKNLIHIFTSFGRENVTKGSHLEKLCLIREGVGRDLISDFTTNLIKNYLLEYTQAFSIEHIDKSRLTDFMVDKVNFNYETMSWTSKKFTLPLFNNDFVLLTPTDILTKDDIWINKNDMISDFHHISNSLENDALRGQVNLYFESLLSDNYNTKEKEAAAFKTIQKFPEIIDYYIKLKEENGSQAEEQSFQKVQHTEEFLISNAGQLIGLLEKHVREFKPEDSLSEALNRVMFLKDIMEKKDGYKIFGVADLT